MTVRISPQERFWRKVNILSEHECWIYGGSQHWTGYGVFWFEGKNESAHRYAYESSFGPVPDGLVLDHLCRNRMCVNPWHLEPVTQAENKLRGVSPVTINAAKTHCSRGHEFSPENTRHGIGPTGRAFRQCVTCVRKRDRDNKRRIRNAKQKELRP